MLTHLGRGLMLASLTAVFAIVPLAPVSAQVTPLWSAPVEVADDTYIFSPKLGLSDDGSQAVAVWSDSVDLISRAAIVNGDSATWGADIQVATGAPGNVELAISGNGDVALAAWRQNSNLAHYAIGTITGTSVTWMSPVSLGCNCLVQPALSADGTRATLVYHDTSGDAIRSQSGIISGGSATWSSIATISTGSAQVGEPQVGLSADGQTIFAFFAANTTGISPVFKAVIGTVSGGTPTVTWGSVGNVSNGTRSYSPQIAFARDGSTALVAWWDIVAYPDVRVYSRTAAISGTSTTWSPIEAHTGAGTADSTRVAISGDGSSGMIGWSRSAYGSDTKAVVTRAADISGSATTWSAPVVVPGSDGLGSIYDVKMAADGSLAAVMWASVSGGVVAPTVSTTTLANGLDWDPGSVLQGSLSPASAAYPALAMSVDGLTAAATWTVVGTPNKLYVNTGSHSAPAPPAPQPAPAPMLASAPRSVSALAGDASASLTWSAPESSGSFLVSHYLATSTPGAHTCLVTAPALNCEVTGLTNGTPYTFTVKALTGAGWSPASESSNVVVPRASDTRAIVISGSREGQRVMIEGTATGMGMGGELNPYVRFPGQSGFTQGSATILVSVDGTFEWSRKAGKRISVYVATPDGSMRSNTVTISAR